MKLQSIVPRKIRKALYRLFRFNPVVEAIFTRLRKTDRLSFHEIGLDFEVSEDDVLIDCGANVGDITSRMAATGATVYAFEPDPDAFSVLTRRFARNRKIILINKGAMDREGYLHFYFRSLKKMDRLESSAGSSFIAVKNEKNPGGTVQVECVDLAKFIFDLGRPVKLIKMDIEGAEVQVLSHLLNTDAMARVGHMVVETHENQIPGLVEDMTALRKRITELKLDEKISLEWV